MRFGLIGDGYAAKRHKEAIKHIDGELVWISDPIVGSSDPCLGVTRTTAPPSSVMYNDVDFVVICSPTAFHYAQAKEALDRCPGQVICEKPLCLPWEPLIDDDRINICLQLRYIENLPKRADLVRAIMVRDEKFFKSWKGDPRQAGGNIYEFYIHYLDLSILLGADFEGSVLPKGEQVREIIWEGDPSYSMSAIHKLDIMTINIQDLYNRMYEDILKGGGIKPKDIFYLKWVLDQNSMKFGYRYAGINNKIFIGRDLL